MKTPILLPKGVEIRTVKDGCEVTGPKGMVERSLPEEVVLDIQDGATFIKVREGKKLSKSMHGLYYALVSNAVIGVSQGFEKQLQLIGVGYRASVQGGVLDLQLGHSHPVQLPIPKGLMVTVEKTVFIKISGIDKQLVGQFASNVRAARPPEVYKGKGVRYVGEHVRKKSGKSAKGK